jgi:hypothetical protein
MCIHLWHRRKQRRIQHLEGRGTHVVIHKQHRSLPRAAKWSRGAFINGIDGGEWRPKIKFQFSSVQFSSGLQDIKILILAGPCVQERRIAWTEALTNLNPKTRPETHLCRRGESPLRKVVDESKP